MNRPPQGDTELNFSGSYSRDRCWRRDKTQKGQSHSRAIFTEDVSFLIPTSGGGGVTLWERLALEWLFPYGGILIQRQTSGFKSHSITHYINSLQSLKYASFIHFFTSYSYTFTHLTFMETAYYKWCSLF